MHERIWPRRVRRSARGKAGGEELPVLLHLRSGTRVMSSKNANKRARSCSRGYVALLREETLIRPPCAAATRALHRSFDRGPPECISDNIMLYSGERGAQIRETEEEEEKLRPTFDDSLKEMHYLGSRRREILEKVN